MESPDRRNSRTQRWLRKAFLELVKEKPYEEITIQDVTDRADTARVTFYRHYRSKEELLIDCLGGLYHDLRESLPEISVQSVSDPNASSPILMLYHYLDANFELYRTLIMGPVGALVERQLRQYMVELITQTIPKMERTPALPVPTDVLANQVAASMLGVVIWWLESNRLYPMEYLARFSHWFMMMGLKGSLDLPLTLAPPNLSWP